MSLPLIKATWQAPTSVVAFTTTTAGGVSSGDCHSFNVATHVGDDMMHVNENRARLQDYVGEAVTLCWLNQTHSDIIVNVNDYRDVVEGDAAFSDQAQRACVVMTADCLPVLLCNSEGTRVAALHCGWRGLYQQLIQQTIEKHFANDRVMAWLGPAIDAQSYEVDTPLYTRFTHLNPAYQNAFTANREGHYLFDLYAIARRQLQDAGVLAEAISGGDFDTFSDSRFFSYRRSPHSGRIASVIYLR